jgi:hypothetical protein
MINRRAEILTSGYGPQVTLESFLVRPIGRKINDEQNKV